MSDLHRNYIAGEWTPGAETANNINPSDLSDVIGVYARADRTQADAAIGAARAAFPAWAASSVQDRFNSLDTIGNTILARKDELGRLLSREEGKTLPEGVGEAARAGQIFKFFAGETLRLAGEKIPSVRPGIDVEVTREPIGVVGIITPWNFPIAIPAWKIAPALAYGNCVVFKPAELVPGSAWALAEIIVNAGVPKGVFNLVMGRGSVVGEAMINDRRVDAISFTGSVATGHAIAAKAIKRMAKLQLEMGGKNPLVVLDDADLGVAVNCAINGAFFSTGQRCTASSRLIVGAGIHDRFVSALSERLTKLKVDDALAPGTDIGPVVDETQLKQDLEYIGIGQQEGAKLVAGGQVLEREQKGPLPGAGSADRGDQCDAHVARGNLRTGRQRDPGQRLRRSTCCGQRYRLRAFRGHRHHVAQARIAFQARQRGRHGDGQPADRRRRLPRPVRRPQRLELRSARAGTLRPRVLYRRQDCLHLAMNRIASLYPTIESGISVENSYGLLIFIFRLPI